MLKLLKKALSVAPKVNYGKLIRSGALIVDVRTREEYVSGHVKGSVNIPLDVLEIDMYQLGEKNNPIITCCASGARSGAAKHLLAKHGFSNVYNGGSWHSLQNRMDKEAA